MLRFGTLDEPAVLDPLLVERAGAREITALMFRELTVHDPDWRLVPDLAARLPEPEPPGADGYCLRWTLRPGGFWSDGVPVSSADVLRAAELEPELRALPAGRFRLTALDAEHFRACWPEFTRDFARPRIHPLVPAHVYPTPRGTGFAGLGRAPAAVSGPYRPLVFEPGRRLELVPNPHWAGERPAIDQLEWVFFKNEAALEMALRAGAIDAVGEAGGLPLERAEALARDLAATHRVEFTESGVWLHLALRVDRGPTAERAVRQAIEAAVDRRALADLVYAGHATPAYGLFPPRHAAFRPGAAERSSPAARLLAAGYRREKDGWAKSGVLLALDLEFASETATSERAAAVIADQLRGAGIAVRLVAKPFRVLMDRMQRREQAALVLFAWRLDPDWDAGDVLGSSGTRNWSGFRDEILDRWLVRAAHAPNQLEWSAALHGAEDRYRAEWPSIPLLFRRSVSIRPRALEGFRPTGNATPVTWNAETWKMTALDASDPKR